MIPKKAMEAGIFLVKKLLQNGVPDDQIKEGLRLAGKEEDDVNVVFYHGMIDA